MSKIYTKGGDKGSTSLVGGDRVSKSDIRLEAYGMVDELNSYLGVVASSLQGDESKKYLDTIYWVQRMLFNIGALLATPQSKRSLTQSCMVESQHINRIECMIDELEQQLPRQKSFILPGGGVAASYAHVARTVCRSVERRVVALSEKEDVEPSVLIFLNRLSDYLFLLARAVNISEGVAEIEW